MKIKAIRDAKIAQVVFTPSALEKVTTLVEHGPVTLTWWCDDHAKVADELRRAANALDPRTGVEN